MWSPICDEICVGSCKSCDALITCTHNQIKRYREREEIKMTIEKRFAMWKVLGVEKGKKYKFPTYEAELYYLNEEGCLISDSTNHPSSLSISKILENQFTEIKPNFTWMEIISMSPLPEEIKSEKGNVYVYISENDDYSCPRTHYSPMSVSEMRGKFTIEGE